MNKFKSQQQIALEAVVKELYCELDSVSVYELRKHPKLKEKFDTSIYEYTLFSLFKYNNLVQKIKKKNNIYNESLSFPYQGEDGKTYFREIESATIETANNIYTDLYKTVSKGVNEGRHKLDVLLEIETDYFCCYFQTYIFNFLQDKSKMNVEYSDFKFFIDEFIYANDSKMEDERNEILTTFMKKLGLCGEENEFLTYYNNRKECKTQDKKHSSKNIIEDYFTYKYKFNNFAIESIFNNNEDTNDEYEIPISDPVSLNITIENKLFLKDIFATISTFPAREAYALVASVFGFSFDEIANKQISCTDLCRIFSNYCETNDTIKNKFQDYLESGENHSKQYYINSTSVARKKIRNMFKNTR